MRSNKHCPDARRAEQKHLALETPEGAASALLSKARTVQGLLVSRGGRAGLLVSALLLVC